MPPQLRDIEGAAQYVRSKVCAFLSRGATLVGRDGITILWVNKNIHDLGETLTETIGNEYTPVVVTYLGIALLEQLANAAAAPRYWHVGGLPGFLKDWEHQLDELISPQLKQTGGDVVGASGFQRIKILDSPGDPGFVEFNWGGGSSSASPAAEWLSATMSSIDLCIEA